MVMPRLKATLHTHELNHNDRVVGRVSMTQE